MDDRKRAPSEIMRDCAREMNAMFHDPTRFTEQGQTRVSSYRFTTFTAACSHVIPHENQTRALGLHQTTISSNSLV